MTITLHIGFPKYPTYKALNSLIQSIKNKFGKKQVKREEVAQGTSGSLALPIYLVPVYRLTIMNLLIIRHRTAQNNSKIIKKREAEC
jgi:hypothetical protein